MTADRSPQPAVGHVGRRASDYARLDDLLGQAFDSIEQMGSEPPAEAGHPFVLPASTHRDFAEVRDNLDALAHLVGAGAVETTRRLVADLHERTARNEDHLHGTARELAAAKHHLATAISEREHARGVACRLEEEIARDRGDEWLATYVAMLEQQVGPDAIDVLHTRANRQVADAALLAEMDEAETPASPTSYAGRLEQQIRLLAAGMDFDPQPFIDTARKEAAGYTSPIDPGLPVVDDAMLGEHELVFRRDGVTVAVGRIDRLFRPLDTANEIALGAVQEDGPPGGETVDVFAAAGLWPTGVEWRAPTEGSPTWVLVAAPQAFACVVAAPACRPDEAPRPVDVGGTWACPLCVEAPRPYEPSGPVDPPRPPHHQPFA